MRPAPYVHQYTDRSSFSSAYPGQCPAPVPTLPRMKPTNAPPDRSDSARPRPSFDEILATIELVCKASLLLFFAPFILLGGFALLAFCGWVYVLIIQAMFGGS